MDEKEYRDSCEKMPDSEFYYLFGMNLKKGFDEREIDFIFSYTSEIVKSALLEELNYENASMVDRMNMELPAKRKLSQGLLLIKYRARMHDITICCVRSSNDAPEVNIKKGMMSLSEDELKEAIVNYEDLNRYHP